MLNEFNKTLKLSPELTVDDLKKIPVENIEKIEGFHPTGLSWKDVLKFSMDQINAFTTIPRGFVVRMLEKKEKASNMSGGAFSQDLVSLTPNQIN